MVWHEGRWAVGWGNVSVRTSVEGANTSLLRDYSALLAEASSA